VASAVSAADGYAKDRTDWLQRRPQRLRRPGRTSWWSVTCGRRIRRDGAAVAARARDETVAVTCCADSAASRRSGACGGDDGDGDSCLGNSVRSSVRGLWSCWIFRRRDCGPCWSVDGDGDGGRSRRGDETTEEGAAVVVVVVVTVAAGRPWASPTTKWANRRTTEYAQCGPVRGSVIIQSCKRSMTHHPPLGRISLAGAPPQHHQQIYVTLICNILRVDMIGVDEDHGLYGSWLYTVT